MTCDMDNIKFYPELFKIDAYMYNIMISSALGLDFPNCFEDEMAYEFASLAHQIFESMKEPENFTGKYIIQYLKKRN